MAKAPPNVPERGDSVRLRGRMGRLGKLLKYDPESNWATVEWNEGSGPKPKMCHRFELEKAK
jgi:hypothetical protein